MKFPFKYKEIFMYTKELNLLKEKAGLSNQQIADRKQMPVGTVNRIMSGQTPTDTASFQNVVNIIDACGGSVDELVGIKTKAPLQDVSMYDHLIRFHTDQIAYRNKLIRILAIAVGVLVVLIITILLFDIFNPNVGWFKF